MQKSYNVYYNLGYWFMLFIVLVIAAFYVPYFSVIAKPRPSIVHVHFALMSVWIFMLIIQPFLIKYKKTALHKTIGKLSYVVVPLIVLSAYLLIRGDYSNDIKELSHSPDFVNKPHSAVLVQAATYQRITILVLGCFAIFYLLAVVNRRKSNVHARFMLANALTLLGPTVDRILGFDLKVYAMPGDLPLELGSFLITDLIIVGLLIMDYRKKRPVRTLWICLVIYVVMQTLFFVVPGNIVWSYFVSFVMFTK